MEIQVGNYIRTKRGAIDKVDALCGMTEKHCTFRKSKMV